MAFRGWFRESSDSGRPGWRITAGVVVLGVAVSLAAAGYLRAGVTTEAQVALANQGEFLTNSIEDYVDLVSDQVRGFRGLFEASVQVTHEEFQLFSRIVGFTPSSVVLFATRKEGSDGSVSWPVQLLIRAEAIGPGLGSDVFANPVQAEAINRAILTGQPTVSGLVPLHGDAQPGDVFLFQSVTDNGEVIGVVAAIVELSELLGRTADDLLLPGESWEIEDSIESSPDVTTPYEWRRSLEFSGHHFRFSVVSDRYLPSASQRPLLALLVGFLITGLGARLVYDLQRRRRTDDELEWLRRSSVDKDRFLAGVGHELRTPLTAVVGILELAIDPTRTLSAGERVELLATARHSANDIARIVDDFVAAGRMSADALTVRNEPTDLDAIVAKLMASANFDARLQVKTAPDLGLCLGDGLRIAQILLNLLHNASRNARRSVEIGGLSEDRFVTVEVRNDGPAVPTQLSHSLFEPFMARTEGQPQPIGLGLSVSRALARRMGGDLVYQWREGLVVFALKLPALPIAVPALTSSRA